MGASSTFSLRQALHTSTTALRSALHTSAIVLRSALHTSAIVLRSAMHTSTTALRGALSVTASISGVYWARFHLALTTEDGEELTPESGELFYTEGLRFA